MRPKGHRPHLLRLSGDVLIYGSGLAFLQLLSFVTVPVYTRVFTPADYGVIETVSTVATMATLLAKLGLDSAAQRHYFDYSEDQTEERRTVLGTAAWALASVGLATGLLLAVTAVGLSHLLFGDGEQGVLLLLVGLTVPLTCLVDFCREVLRLLRRPIAYSLLTCSLGLLTLGLALVGVLTFDLGLPALFAAGPLAAGLVLIASWVAIRPHLSRAFSARELRGMLRYGLPLVPAGLATWILQFSDRFFLLRLASTHDVGIYSVAVKYANVLMLPVVAFGIAWTPFFLRLHSESSQEERRIRGDVLSVLTFALCFCSLLLALGSSLFFRTVTSKAFSDAAIPTGLLLLTTVLVGQQLVLATSFTLSKQTHYFVRYTAYAAVANAVLNVVLIRPLGITGAALATLCAYGLLTGLYWVRGQQLDRVDFDRRGIAFTLVLTGVIATAIPMIAHADPLRGTLVGLVGLAGFTAVAWRTCDMGIHLRHVLSASGAINKEGTP